MFGSKDDLRQKYCDIYTRMQADDPFPDRLDQMIANVIKMHPEYQPLLSDSEKSLDSEFGPDKGQANPFLHMGMHLAVWEQIATNRPDGIRDEHLRLIKLSNEHQAEHQMMEILGIILWEAQRDNVPPDENKYLESIRKI